MPKTSRGNSLSFHCVGGKNKNRKRGFTYFLCCGCGPKEGVDEESQPEKRPLEKPELGNTNLPSSGFQERSSKFDSQRISSQLPSRPLPPAYNIERNKSRVGKIPVSNIRDRFEEFGIIRSDRRTPTSPGCDAYSSNLPNGVQSPVGGAGGAANRDMLETDQPTDKTLESRGSFKSIFGNAPLYQIYDAHTKRKESRRFRHRFKESLRKIRQTHKTAKGEMTVPLQITPASNFEGYDESSSSSAEEEEQQNNVNKSDFKVIVRAEQRKPSNVTRTAKDGEMQNVAREFAGAGPCRVHWGDMPDVKRLHLAEGLTPQQRNLQEARFEIITSEASYYKSLNILVDLFYKSPVFLPNSPNSVINATDKHQLFSNIIDICNTSENMLHALELSFRRDPMMENICDILYQHSEKKLSYYIAYVKNQMYQTRTLAKLMNRPDFAEAVKDIQSMPVCKALDLNSFLVLPMQRVMRLRLLVAAVLHYTPKNTPAYHSGLIALASLETLIGECNSQKGLMERKERLMTLSSQLEFKNTLKAIGMSNRHLIKEGNLRLLSTSKLPAQSLRRKLSDAVKNKFTQITLFLFTDVLLIAKRRGEKYFVEDLSLIGEMEVTVEYTPPEAEIKRTDYKIKANPDDPYYIMPRLQSTYRNSLNRVGRQVTPPNIRHRTSSRSSTPSSGTGTGGEVTSSSVFTFILTFQSSDLTIVDYHFMTDTLEQRERWIDALQPAYYKVPPEISYDTWDCPQVIAISSYSSVERDELDLKEGDLVNVIVDLSDGWLKGALPDGRAGWVPKSVCAEVEDPQARRQNMKNFLLSEEAKRAYENQKAADAHVPFLRVQDYRSKRV